MTNQDAYVEGIAEIYQVNILPYMEAWGLRLSDQVKAKVYENNYPLMNILKDMVNENTLQAVINGEGMDRKYGLVSNEILQSMLTLTASSRESLRFVFRYSISGPGTFQARF